MSARHEEWIKAYFNLQKDEDLGVGKDNFFEVGLVDSFGVLELIDAIEKEFCIRFENSHFTDRRFSTISGLAEIIAEIENE